MKILILSKYTRKGASSRYRLYNYEPYFVKNKIKIDFVSLFDDRYVDELYAGNKWKIITLQVRAIFFRIHFLIFLQIKYDLIIIEKELFTNIPYFVENFLLRNRRYAVDFDDYIASDYKLSPFKSLFLYNKIDHLARKAQFVTVGNHWYFDEIKSNNLIYLPTVIDLESYPNVKRNFKTEKVTIVWIGSPSTVKYLSFIIPVLERLNKKYPIKFKVIGANIPPVKNLEIDLVKWNAETEADELISSDIGVMPLKETLFEKGKCGFKLIQYMACGLPVVASALPANIEIVENGSDGYIVRNDEEWYYSLEKLIIDENLRKKFGQSGRKKIESNYSYQIWGDKYLKMIKDA